MARKRIKVDPSGYSILVVDDQDETLISCKLLLEREGHHVLTAVDGREALSLISDEQFDLIVVDYFMPQMNCEELVRAIRNIDSDVQIILETGYSGEKRPRHGAAAARYPGLSRQIGRARPSAAMGGCRAEDSRATSPDDVLVRHHRPGQLRRLYRDPVSTQHRLRDRQIRLVRNRCPPQAFSLLHDAKRDARAGISRLPGSYRLGAAFLGDCALAVFPSAVHVDRDCFPESAQGSGSADRRPRFFPAQVQPQ